MFLSIDMLVHRVCATLRCDLSLSDEVLRLLVCYKWDVDDVVDRVTSSMSGSNGHSVERLSSHSGSYRCLSTVMNKLRGLNIRNPGSRVHQGADGVRCVCGVSMDSEGYALKTCGHWHCRSCWMAVVDKSLAAQEFIDSVSANNSAHPAPSRSSSSCVSLWCCPHASSLSGGGVGGGKCGELMRGDLVSHLCGVEGPVVRGLFYRCQLRLCVAQLLRHPLGTHGAQGAVTKDFMGVVSDDCDARATHAVMAW